jgi:hypothetical protein
MHEERKVIAIKRRGDSIERKADNFVRQLGPNLVSTSQGQTVKGVVVRILTNVDKGIVQPWQARRHFSRIRNYVKTRSIEKTANLERKEWGKKSASLSGVRDFLQRYGLTLRISESLRGKPHAESKKIAITHSLKALAEKKSKQLAYDFYKAAITGGKIPARSEVRVSPHIYDSAKNMAATQYIEFWKGRGYGQDNIEVLLGHQFGYSRDVSRLKIRHVLGM